MAKADHLRQARAPHPFHAVILAGTLPLFLGALLSDWAYTGSYQIQWANFASWLVAGGLIFAGLALLWAVTNLFGAKAPGDRNWLYAGLISAVFAVGFVNALVHARDAWATMPAGIMLSLITFLLAAAATWAAYSGRRTGIGR